MWTGEQYELMFVMLMISGADTGATVDVDTDDIV